MVTFVPPIEVTAVEGARACRLLMLAFMFRYARVHMPLYYIKRDVEVRCRHCLLIDCFLSLITPARQLMLPLPKMATMVRASRLSLL